MAFEPSASHDETTAHTQETGTDRQTLASQAWSPDTPLDSFLRGYLPHASHPLTPRAKNVLRAADAVIRENQHAPANLWDVLESKGTIEGLYARLYQRRDRLWMKYDRRAKSWSLRLAQDVAVDSLVADILAHHELSVTEASAADRQRDWTKQKVIAAILLALGLYADLATDARNMAAAASAEGMALGQTAAAALLAFVAGHKIPDMDSLQQETLAQLKRSADYWNDTDAVITSMIEGLAGDVAKSISKMIQDGATHDQIASYVTATLGAGAGASFYLDSHIHALFALALLAAYKQAGTLVDFVTVGDARVCPACLAAEDGNPWKPNDVPPIPYHGGCRCWYAPAH